MARLYTDAATASTPEADALHDKRRGTRYPPIEQDGRDAEARRLLAAYYRACWQRARDLQDPTWWMSRARERGGTL